MDCEHEYGEDFEFCPLCGEKLPKIWNINTMEELCELLQEHEFSESDLPISALIPIRYEQSSWGNALEIRLVPNSRFEFRGSIMEVEEPKEVKMTKQEQLGRVIEELRVHGEKDEQLRNEMRRLENEIREADEPTDDRGNFLS
jgi:hypothetical protein